MHIYRQSADNIIDSETEIHYAILSNFNQVKYPHCHDFYELLLVIDGSLLLEINNTKMLLEEGSLVLIRPQDIHGKKFIKPGLQINVAFPQKTVKALYTYLGDGFPKKKLLNPEIIPRIILSKTEKNYLLNSLKKLNLVDHSDKEILKTQLRLILLEIFTKYLIPESKTIDHMPTWLEYTLNEIKKKENFQEGIPALIQLSEKSHEHLCRLFKKYMDTTPTKFINELRLTYSTNLLIHSDMKIIDICLDSGFKNLSNYYHIFQKKHNCSPLKYRKQHQPTSLFS